MKIYDGFDHCAAWDNTHYDLFRLEMKDGKRFAEWYIPEYNGGQPDNHENIIRTPDLKVVLADSLAEARILFDAEEVEDRTGKGTR